ncbi:hypothetical protein GCM10011348_41090 [Marinobacterium nitratireducens]|uniref:Uncharacterized protein n=1 Tax=Marinobacterium nitratireducens TaxID=518897 RepID=A0A918DXX0_9GAMM|nr:hypothetical protein [Marinobacterium nitratireducens]GGO87577.1 hypothetical protein GCM10011348_41090 [Marinobacterium nitratireducens]
MGARTTVQPPAADPCLNAGPGARLLSGLRRRGLRPVGERSCKLRQGRVLPERFLLGVPVSQLAPEDFGSLLAEFGLDSRGRQLFDQHFPGASEVQFAVEQDGDRVLCKVYLEYWDRLLQRLGRGDEGPALLNLGFKWQAGRPADLVLDSYLCLPRIRHLDIVGRVRERAGELGDAVADLVLWAAAAVPDRELVYLEVDGGEGGRYSYDINLYPCRRSLSDAAPRLQALAGRLCCDGGELDALLERHARAPLGHISGGRDRQGRGFFTFYYAVGAL